MNKIAEFIAYGACFMCSAFVGNGYSPVFSVMAESRRRNTDIVGTLSFFGVKFINDLVTGVLLFTAPHYVVWMIAYACSKWGSVVSSISFYLISNSVCFFQMAGSFYPFTAGGYFECMAAGLPFLAHSIVGCLTMDLLFRFIEQTETRPFALA